MIKQLFATILLLAALAMPTLAQTSGTVTALQEERIILVLTGDPVHGTTVANTIGLTPAGEANFLSLAQNFYASHAAAVAQSNQQTANYNNGVPGALPPNYSQLIARRDSNVQSTWNNILMVLTDSQDQTALQTFMQAEITTMTPSGDMVAGNKWGFLGGWGDGGDIGDDGYDDLTYIDGYSGGALGCLLDGYTDQSIATAFTSILAPAPANITQLVAATDGTLLSRTSASALAEFDQVSQTWIPLTGAGLEITGSYTGGIYTVGTNGVLFGLNTWTNQWIVVSGAGYPWGNQAVNHVAADGSDYSVWVAKAKQLALYVPTQGKWVIINTPVAPVSLTTNYVYSAAAGPGNQSWYAYFIGTDGAIYDAYYYESNGASGVYKEGPTDLYGYTGTPQTIRVTEDKSLTMKTTTGYWQTLSSSGAFEQVTNVYASTPAFTADGVHGIYWVGPAGDINQLVTNKITEGTELGFGNVYMTTQTISPFNNFEGNPVPSTNTEKVTQSCGQIHSVLLDNSTTSYIENAETLTSTVSATAPQPCGAYDTGNHCIKYNVKVDCTTVTTPPDHFQTPTTLVRIFNPAPWGFMEDALCISFTGKQPFHCAGSINRSVANYSVPYTCTSHK